MTTRRPARTETGNPKCVNLLLQSFFARRSCLTVYRHIVEPVITSIQPHIRRVVHGYVTHDLELAVQTGSRTHLTRRPTIPSKPTPPPAPAPNRRMPSDLLTRTNCAYIKGVESRPLQCHDGYRCGTVGDYVGCSDSIQSSLNSAYPYCNTLIFNEYPFRTLINCDSVKSTPYLFAQPTAIYEDDLDESEDPKPWSQPSTAIIAGAVLAGLTLLALLGLGIFFLWRRMRKVKEKKLVEAVAVSSRPEPPEAPPIVHRSMTADPYASGSGMYDGAYDSYEPAAAPSGQPAGLGGSPAEGFEVQKTQGRGRAQTLPGTRQQDGEGPLSTAGATTGHDETSQVAGDGLPAAWF
ncbi:hypothetical protein QBC47DRAFT_355475 [Echria macrotheca]|uniref:Uncharacterized protein n=1 Tax=Echria macrotheca TaxID=438768 RepID=A0AAJ0BN52_9PEZI|nr:hypothetical protein QBC47DRAFT_355475 [Echria macrotheca]